MSPELILDENAHAGVRALKDYISYARDGKLSFSQRTGAECDSEFERWVIDWLKSEGFDAVPQVGFAGYAIDIAVKNPQEPGVFLCGIECDGASYHSARSVRERDRLREEILVGLGWNIYRIWSTDWFRNPKLQAQKLLDYLKRLAS